MGMQFVKKIPTAEELFAFLPLPEHLKQVKAERDSAIKDVFEEKDKRFLLLIAAGLQKYRKR